MADTTGAAAGAATGAATGATTGTTGDKAGLYIEGRAIRNFADIQRNYLYEITFKSAFNLIPDYCADEEDITLRVRSFSIPQRGNEAIESNFGAMKQFFPGKPTFGNTIQITFEETESQFTQSFLFAWQQRLFDVNHGHANFTRKRGGDSTVGTYITNSNDTGICDLVTIKAFRYNGDELDNKYYLYNVWLQNVDDVSLDYSQNEAVKFTATFQFDFWTYGTEEPTFDTTGTTSEIDVGNNSTISEG